MNDLKQETERLLALADAATPGPWAVHPSRAVVVPSPHASRPIGCHENPVIDRETYAQEICALHWPDRNRNESEVRSNANLIASAPDMATHLRALQAEVDRLQAECEALRGGSSMWTAQEAARMLANRPNQPHYIEAIINKCISAAMNRATHGRSYGA